MKRLSILLLLTLFALPAAAQFGCATTQGLDEDGYLITLDSDFFGLRQEGHSGVTLHPVQDPQHPVTLPETLQTALEYASNAWNNKCPGATFSNIPAFGFSDSPYDPSSITQIGVVFKPNDAPPPGNTHGTIAPASYGGNIITLYGRCPPGNVLPCWGNQIDWRNTINRNNIIHEIGHSMGIGHDLTDGSCSRVNGIMRSLPQNNASLLDEYCNLADQQNCKSDDPATPHCPYGPYRVLGTVSGLDTLDNGQQEFVTITITGSSSTGQAPSHTSGAGSANPSFETPAIFPEGMPITIRVDPPHQNKQCVVTPGTATVARQNVTVAITCTCIQPPLSSRGITTQDICYPDDYEQHRPIIEYPPPPDFDVDCTYGWWWIDCEDGPPTGTGNCQRVTICKPGPPDCSTDFTGDGIPDCSNESLICIDQCVLGPKIVTLHGPRLWLDTPRDSQTAASSLPVSGWATDPQGVHSVRFFVDKQQVTLADQQTGIHRPDSCGSPSATCNPNGGFSGTLSLAGLAPGVHEFSVVAVDNDPNYPTPALYQMAINVQANCGDSQPPSVQLVSPTGGATVTGRVPLGVIAADNVRVTSVEYFVDSTLKATVHYAPFAATWDASNASNGSHTIVARARDACGNTTSSAPVTVVVQGGAQRRPRAHNDQAQTSIGTATIIDVTSNDTDPDGDPIALTNTPIVTLPRRGTAERVSNASIRYTPPAGYAGNDSFEYEIADSAGLRDRAWVTVKVSGTNAAPIALDDVASTNGNSNITIDVTANDNDPDGDAVSLVASPFVTMPAGGTVQRISASSVGYTPGASFSGTDHFQYEIGDGKGKRARAWVTVTVSSANRAPVANPDSATTHSNAPVTVDVTANDSDPDGDAITLVNAAIVIEPLHGSATRVSNSSISYVPVSGFAGTDSFQYEIGDGNGRRARATVSITVVNTNHAPEAVDDDAATTAGTAVTVAVTANDSDADGDPVLLIATPIVVAPSNGTAVKISGTSITYTPRTGFTGTDRFQYEIGDGYGARARAWVDVTVSATPVVNHNPDAVDDAAATPPGTTVVITVTANDSDPDGDPVALVSSPIIYPPSHGTASRTSNTSITYIPAANFVGVDGFQYEIGDGRGKRARAWVRVSVTDSNSRPMGIDDTAYTAPGSAVSIEVTANDIDPDGDPVTLIANPVIEFPAHGAVTRLSNTTLRYTPQQGFSGTDRFRYEIGDGHGNRARAWVMITVASQSATGAMFTEMNSAPIAVNDFAVGLIDTPMHINVLANDLDLDGEAIRLADSAVTIAPRFGIVQRLSPSTLVYIPPSRFEGNDGFEYEIVDDRGGQARAWVAVQVPGNNTPPTAVNDRMIVDMNRNATLIAVANDHDADGDSLTLTASAIVRQPARGTVRRTSDTEITYTPHPNALGLDVFIYEITDGKGATAQASVTVSILDSSLPPLAADDAYGVEAGKTAVLAVLSNDSDPDDEPIRVVSSTQPGAGRVIWDETSTNATYAAPPGFVGTDTFTYTISDTRGLESTATVTMTVTPVQRPPVLQNDSAETPTRTPVLIGVLANDYDPDWNRLSVTSVTSPAHGSVVINRFESVTYTPANDFAGTDTFTYTVSDGTGLQATATVTVTMPNAPPLPRSEILAAHEDVWVGYTSLHVLNNDTDPDGDELHIVSVEQPQHGTFIVTPDQSQFSYKSHDNWHGMDSFHYTVSDPFGASVRLMSQISVVSVNDPPVAGDDSFSIYKNQVLTITESQVVANDTDLEGHTISLYSVGEATNGSVQLVDGSIEYRPYGEFVGNDSFVYTIEDSGGSAYGSGRIHVTVLQDTPPVPSFTVTCNGLTCSFDASASTDDRGIVTYQWILKTGPTSSSPAAGKTFNFTYPAEGFFDARLTVTDAIGQTAAIIKWVNVCAPAGIATHPASQTITSGYTASLSVTANGSGPFSYQWYEGTSGTTTTPVGTNSSSYTTPGLTGNKNYWVRVTSTCSGTVSVNSNTATISVCGPPTIATQPASTTINSGGTATLSVVAGGSGPFTYQWYDEANTYVGYGSTYTTPALTANKSYWVRVNSTCNGTMSVASNLATVTVCDLPGIGTHPAPKLINAGQTTTLSVIATGSAPLSYQWYQGASGTITTPVGTNSSSFTTPALSASTSYWVRVTSTCNGSTTANSNAALVTVCTPPGFAAQPASKTIATGSSTTLNVTPSGSGPFSYQWYEGTSGTTTTPVGTNSSSFTTPALTTNKSYWVRVTSTCNGSASANSNTATITMTCATPPSISSSPASTTIVIGTSTTLSVTASGFGSLTYQWYQGTAPSTTTPLEANGNSLTVAPGATTSYWVSVSNACGGTASATATVTVCTPPSIATQPASTTINSGATATLSVVAGGTGPFTYQWFEGASGVTTTPVGTNSSTFTTPPLTATRSYWVRVSNACSRNSNAATITVNQAALARRQFAASAANSQLSITTNWTQPTQSGTLLVAIISASSNFYPVANWTVPSGYQLAASYEMNGIKTSIYYYPNHPGGRTAEAFGTGGPGMYRDMILQLAEYVGVVAASPLDKTAFNGNNTADGYIDTGYTTQTAQAKELVITAVTSHAQTEFFGPSQGFVELDDRFMGWNLTTAVHEKIVTTAGSWGHYAQTTAPNEWVGLVVTFKAAN